MQKFKYIQDECGRADRREEQIEEDWDKRHGSCLDDRIRASGYRKIIAQKELADHETMSSFEDEDDDEEQEDDLDGFIVHDEEEDGDEVSHATYAEFKSIVRRAMKPVRTMADQSSRARTPPMDSIKRRKKKLAKSPSPTRKQFKRMTKPVRVQPSKKYETESKPNMVKAISITDFFKRS